MWISHCYTWQSLEQRLYSYYPCSWGVSGALHLQAALAGVIFCLGYSTVGLPWVSSVDVWVLRNESLWTVSGQEWSSTKQKCFMCREGAWTELAVQVTLMVGIQRRMHGLHKFFATYKGGFSTHIHPLNQHEFNPPKRPSLSPTYGTIHLVPKGTFF